MNIFVIFASVLVVARAQTLPEVLTREGASTLVGFLEEAGLDDVLSEDGPFTVFAPTNEAFGKLPDELVDTLKNDPDLLKKVLLYHVVPARLLSGDAEDDDILVESQEGTQLRINTYMKRFYYDGFLTVNGKRVSRADVEADNGVVHFVTDVIYPFADRDIPTVLKEAGHYKTLLAALEKGNLLKTLEGDGPFTLFAPTDDAFDEIPEADLNEVLEDEDRLKATLTRHVVPKTLFAKGIVWDFLDTVGDVKIATHVFKGGYTRVVSETEDEGRKRAKIVEYDMVASNGVVHGIDTVI